MSAIEVQLQRLGILASITRACEEAGLTLMQLSEVFVSAMKEDAMRNDVSLAVFLSSDEEACKMMVDALRDLGTDTLSGEEAFELCGDF